MSKTTYERGETLVYPSHYPTLTFTPIFGHRGDFMWVDEVKAAWPEHGSEFTFVRDTIHDERVDRLKTLVRDMWWTMVKAAWDGEQPSLTDIRERIDDAGVDVDDINQNNFQSTKFLVDLSVAREVDE